MQLVECIPNFSEGRRHEVIRAIFDAIKAVPGVIMLDQTSDKDHNRTVITFAGEPHAVVEGAFAGIKTAAELIDLDEHRGVHPRMGAADVVPFVPLENITLEECANLARKLGMRVGEELNLPVFLYEAAATRPEHISLANVRRGGYEGLKETLGKDDLRTPDFGPLELGKAGAVIIGARNTLIAFNVFLNTDDEEIARKIAQAVRHSSGGLAFVRALGLLVNGKAQVSMNLTNHLVTPIPHVMEMIRSLTARYGVQVERSELIGLIPQQAVVDTVGYYLQLDRFEQTDVLEHRLRLAGELGELEDKEPTNLLRRDVIDEDDRPTVHALPLLTGDPFLSQLAAGTPTPGGGAAAAYSAAMGASLVAMVARTTLGKKKYADVGQEMAQIIRRSDGLRRRLEQAARDDAAAFDALIAAYRMSEDEERKNGAVEQALRHAAEVPLSVMRMAAEVIQLAVDAAEKGNKNAVADAAAAVSMAHAALKAAEINVRVNVRQLKDQDVAERWIKDELNSLRSTAEQYEARVRQIVQERANVEV